MWFSGQHLLTRKQPGFSPKYHKQTNKQKARNLRRLRVEAKRPGYFALIHVWDGSFDQSGIRGWRDERIYLKSELADLTDQLDKSLKEKSERFSLSGWKGGVVIYGDGKTQRGSLPERERVWNRSCRYLSRVS